jgi:Flp pilus assembly pilin Flp
MMENSVGASARRFLHEEDGPTAVEYAVMLALILVACITICTFSDIVNAMQPG